MKRVLIIGSGFSGAVIARELADAGSKSVIIDKRSHIGGNAFDYIDKHGIRIHKYGPHIFHTNSKVVFEWLSRFTEWIPYKHKVKAQLGNGRYVTLPINKETSEIVGKENIISTFIRPYSEKMWGIKLEELDPNILNRVPMRDDLNEFYFPNDQFQFMPKEGYSQIFKNILDHPNITVKLNTEYSRTMENSFDHIFCSMPIDEYYDYIFGPLPYRSIKFTNVHFPTSLILPNAVVNFTHNGPETRVTEWKHFPEHGVNNQMTTLTYETPCDYTENKLERYYPVKDNLGNNKRLYYKYKKIKNEKVSFIGRLGQYAYLDMDQCINSALQISKIFIKKNGK
jgi:UDP-galactopyranose mutase